MSRQITSPLAVCIATMLNANVPIAVTMVVLTGLLGASLSIPLLAYLKITNPVVRGIAVGCTSHGLGTAAMKDEVEAFPVAAVGMAMTGAVTTVLVAVRPVRLLLRAVAMNS